jgi:hypothetical protein
MNEKDSIKPFIIQTIVMRLSEKESLDYLKDRGFDISVPYYYKLKKKITESRFDRLSLIGKTQFVDQHLERIDQLELINQEMWSQYRKGNYQAMDALLKIADLQTYISPYYDASRYVMEQSIKNETKENQSISV